MSDLAIDRLSLHLTGLPEQDGERLALLVADGLAAAPLPPRRPRQSQGQAGNVQVSADAHPGESVDQLGARLVAEILAAIERAL